MSEDRSHYLTEIDKETFLKARNYSPTMPDPQTDETWIEGLRTEVRERILECIHFIHKFQKHRKILIEAQESLSSEADDDKMRHLALRQLEIEASIYGLQDIVMWARIFPECN
ncbi:hypothetical protein [Nisaea sp.]|uniref:hypothetical protein n=1 Tax=Nisaea sp. TaxID=2024842 RepID=UPI00329872B3